MIDHSYIPDDRCVTNYAGIAGGILGLSGSILFILPLNNILLFSWEGVGKIMLTIVVAGVGPVFSIFLKDLYNGVKPKVINYVTGKFDPHKIKRRKKLK